MFQALRDRLDKDEDGFTLIELLVVVIIIGILAAIAIPTFLNQRERAWRDEIGSDLRNGTIAMEEAYNTTGAYPAGATAPAGMKTSGNVTFVKTTATAASTTTGATYCIEMSHSKLATGGQSWRLNTAGASAPEVGTC